MHHMFKRTKIITLSALGVFILAGCLHFIKKFEEGSLYGNFSACSTAVLYAALLIAWVVSANYRITQKNLRIYLTYSVLMMIFWLIVREAKFQFFAEMDTVVRNLWYSYYFFVVFIPLMVFYSTLNIGKYENNSLNYRWKLLIIPAVILLAGVVTNDLHHYAFSFLPEYENWDRYYTHEIIYYLVVAWNVILIISCLGIVFYKCQISNNKKSVILPFIFLVVCTIYLLWTKTEQFLDGNKLFQVPEMICFMFVALWESLIQTGLIPSNIGYTNFFKVSSVRASIADTNGNIVYSSANAAPLTPLNMKQAIKNSVLLDKDTRLNSTEIGVGRVYWTEDLKTINRINDELFNVKEQLSEYGDLLRAETEIKKRRAKTAEKNRLYDTITEVVSPQLKSLDILLSQSTPYDYNIKEKYSMACILCAYIKRRANLLLLGEKSALIHAFELESSIRESVEYIKLYGVYCSFIRNISGELDCTLVNFTYELFEEAVEKALPSLTSLIINLTIDNNKMRLRLTMDEASDTISSDWKNKAIEKLGAFLEVNNEDGTIYITFLTSSGES